MSRSNRLFDKQCAWPDCGKAFQSKTVKARFGPCCLWRTKRRGSYRYKFTPEIDRIIRERYDGRRGTTLEITLALGWSAKSCWVVRKRAQILGITRPKNAHVWTAEEDAFLEQNLGVREPVWISRALKRSLSAVCNRAKRLMLSREIRDGYTLEALTQCFGQPSETISSWIRRGLLKGTRRGEAGVVWHFTDEAVRRFLREHRNVYRLDRVDQLWFLDMVFGGNLNGSERVA